MSTVMVDREVWSFSHACWDFSESSSACRLVSCDSIQITDLRSWASASSSSTRLRLASCARTRTSVSITWVVTSSEPRVDERSDPGRLQRLHGRAELRARHPHHEPGVGRLAVVVGLGVLLADLAALRVDDPLHVTAGLADVRAGERDRAARDDRAVHLRRGRPLGAGAASLAPADSASDVPISRSAGASAATPAESEDVPASALLEPARSPVLLSSAEQAARTAVMVIAVRTPAARVASLHGGPTPSSSASVPGAAHP